MQKFSIATATILTSGLISLAVLAGCANPTEPTDNPAETNPPEIYIAENYTTENYIAETYYPSNEPIAPPPAPPEFIPDYITIQGTPFSTALTELDLTRWMLEEYGIAALRYMVNLTRLNLNYNGITDISPLAGLTNLTELRLAGNAPTDLSPLTWLTNLTKLQLNVPHFDDTDLTPLLNLTNLTEFHLMLGGFSTPTEDISRLADLTTLTTLTMWHNQISDLSPLAGLTNLQSLRADTNPITDISPLANLPNLSSVHLSYHAGMDLSPLQNVPPQVPPPTRLPDGQAAAPPANPHPFAVALSEFFVNLTTSGGSFWDMPYSYHAAWVDIDGRGTLGVLASRWFFDGDRPPRPSHWGSISTRPNFEQRLFFMHDNQLQEVDLWSLAATPSGRLVKITADGICDMLVTTYTPLDLVDGELTGVKSVIIAEFTREENWYAVNYHHIDGNLWRDFEQDREITSEEFHEIMARYGLHGAGAAWRLPNAAYEILGMSADLAETPLNVAQSKQISPATNVRFLRGNFGGHSGHVWEEAMPFEIFMRDFAAESENYQYFYEFNLTHPHGGMTPWHTPEDFWDFSDWTIGFLQPNIAVWHSHVAVLFDTAVQDFQFVVIDHFPEETGNRFFIDEVLFSAETLPANQPFFTSWPMLKHVPMRAVTFVDEFGAARVLTILDNFVGGDVPSWGIFELEVAE